jgi:hypothetical protein
MAASNFSVTPALSDSSPGNDSLTYWFKDLGPTPAGKALPVIIRYTKNDARTSREILGPATANSSANTVNPTANATGNVNGAAAAPADDGSSRVAPAARDSLILSAVFAGLAVLVAALFWWRRKSASPAMGAAGYCTRCGNALRTGDRYCSKCGAAAATRPNP